MPTFEYLALDKAGKQNRGSIAAESPSAARKLLRNRHLHATKLTPVSETSKSGSMGLNRLLSGKHRRMVLEVTRQLGTMIEADVKLTEALTVLISQAQDHTLSQILQNVRDGVMAGESLADCLKEYPGWFDSIYIAMVRVGEATGNLGKIISLLADYMTKKQRLESKVKSALIYPTILVVICVLVIIFLMSFVVPNLTKIIETTGREMPGITKFLMNVSDFITGSWYIILIVLFGAFWLFKRSVASDKGRLFFDQFKLKIPITGELIRQSIVVRFTSTLAALIRSGMPMADSLHVVANVTGNAVMAHAVRQARERIIAGADIATPLRDSKVVGAAVAHMISVGERSGELETMLLTIAESMEESTDVTVQRISAIIEPVIIVIMAIIIGVIILAVMLPILQASNVN